MTFVERIKQLMLSPSVIFGAIILGVLVGIYLPNVGIQVAIFGGIFIALLQMCVLPILITGIVSSIGNLLRKKEIGASLKHLVAIFVVGITVAGLFAIILGVTLKPGGNLSDKDQVILGTLLAESESESTADSRKPYVGFTHFVASIIPNNPFLAITNGKNVAVIFFSILLGFALGFVRGSEQLLVLGVAEELFEAFLKIIRWIMYFLPIGLFCLFASQVAQVGFEAFAAMSWFVTIVILATLFWTALHVAVIWHRSGFSVFKLIRNLRTVIFVALGTSSSFATLPVAMIALEKRLNFNKNMTNLVLPLGVTLNPQGSVIYFSIATLFIAQLYEVSITYSSIIMLVFGSVLAGFAASGLPSVAAVALLAITLEPLGLPVGSATTLLLAVSPIVSPFVTLANVFSNCGAAKLMENSSSLAQPEATDLGPRP